MRLVLIGPPGSGKGTQGVVLAERLDVPYLSTGDLLRDQVARQTPLGRRVADVLDQGELVPDDLIVEAVLDRLAALQHDGGYLLDGFPRTVAQAESADEELPDGLADIVVYLSLSDDVARERLRHREGGRSDDADQETVEHRLGVFHRETEPLVDYYRARGVLRTVDGDRPPEEVTAAILAAVHVV